MIPRNEMKLNEAAWVLHDELSALEAISPRHFNNLKPCLRAAIECYQKDDKLVSLTKEQTEWLHGIMQNPLHSQTPVDEDSRDKEMRYSIFDATK